MRTIEIDWDVHQAIEAERRGFDDSPNDALRRLLKLGMPSGHVNPAETGIPWVEDGVVVPHGAAARMSYLHGRQKYEGRFLDGKLVVNGQQFKTLSQAAGALAITKEGGKASLNGWNYWEAQFPGEQHWRSLKKMREALK